MSIHVLHLITNLFSSLNRKIGVVSIILILFYSSLLTAQGNLISPLLPDTHGWKMSHFDLRGPVKKLTTEQYEISLDSFGMEIRKKYTYNDCDNAVLHFSPQGWISSIDSYGTDTLGNAQLWIKIRYERNKNGQITLWEEKWPEDPDSHLKVIYKYDKSGLLLQEDYLMVNDNRRIEYLHVFEIEKEQYKMEYEYFKKELKSQTRYIYSLAGDTITLIHYLPKSGYKIPYSKGKPLGLNPDSLVFGSKKSDILNGKGQISERFRYKEHNDTIQYIDRIFYREDGKILKWQSIHVYYENDIKKEWISHESLNEFNKEGDVIRWTQRSASPIKSDLKVIAVSDYEYIYDDRGNWTERKTFEDGILQWVEYRTFTYY